MRRTRSRRTRILRTIVVLLSLAFTGAVHARMDTTSRARRSDAVVPSPQHARISSLGFDALMSDYFWLTAVQIVGRAVLGIEDKAPQVARLVDLVTRLDPWVDHPYRFAAVWLTDGTASVRAANHILERGVAYHPLDWRNRFHLGFNQFFYLEDAERAAEILEPALALEGAPRYLGALVARLRADSGGLDTAAAFLAELVRTTDDEYARAEYQKALDEIRVERAARYLDEARTEFWRRHGRDIREVAEIWQGPARVIRVAPRPHPVFNGFDWVIDDESGQIVSTFYGARYRLHVHPADAMRREEMKRRESEESG